MRMLCLLGVNFCMLGFACAATAKGQDAPDKDRAVKEELKRPAATKITAEYKPVEGVRLTKVKDEQP